MTGRVYLLPIPALAGALLLLHGGGEGQGGSLGGLEHCAPSPVAFLVHLDASGLRRPVLGAATSSRRASRRGDREVV